MVTSTTAQRRFHQSLRRQFFLSKKDKGDHGRRFCMDLRQGLLEHHISRDEISLKQLFEEIVPDGREMCDSFNPKYHNDAFLEAGGGPVMTADFANITGQIVYSAFIDGFNEPNTLFQELFKNVPTQFDGEKIPGVSAIGDQLEAIGEGEPYPRAGVSEEWVETPSTIKRGLIIEVTKEALFFDRTNLIIDRASKVGNAITINKDKRCLDVALGVTTTYRRNGGAAQATYGDTHTNGDFDNLSATTALVDWTDVEAAELLFDALTDPNTGELIEVVPNAIIVPTALKHTAFRIANATFVEHGTRDATNPIVQSPAPTGTQYTVLSTPRVSQRSGDSTTWWIGDPKNAFSYMENWGPTVSQMPPGNDSEWNNDIVAGYKGSERGAAAVIDPRYMVEATA